MNLTKEEMKQALDAIIRLCNADGTQRMIRGYGAFKDEEMPVPGLVKLIEWLKKEALE